MHFHGQILLGGTVATGSFDEVSNKTFMSQVMTMTRIPAAATGTQSAIEVRKYAESLVATGEHVDLLIIHIMATFSEIAAAGENFAFTRTRPRDGTTFIVPLDHAANIIPNNAPCMRQSNVLAQYCGCGLSGTLDPRIYVSVVTVLVDAYRMGGQTPRFQVAASGVDASTL